MNVEEFKKLSIENKAASISMMYAEIEQLKNFWSEIEHFYRNVQSVIEADKDATKSTDTAKIDISNGKGNRLCDQVKTTITAATVLEIMKIGAVEKQQQIAKRIKEAEQSFESLFK